MYVLAIQYESHHELKRRKKRASGWPLNSEDHERMERRNGICVKPAKRMSAIEGRLPWNCGGIVTMV
jgi:hypothetical protein